MRIIILLLIMKEKQVFLCKYVIFRKFSQIFENYFFENIAKFSCRGSQTLSSDMRIIILLFIIKNK